MKTSLLISAAVLFASAPALAQPQDAPADAQTQEAPATTSPEEQAATFSDTEIQAYVKSLAEVQRIDQDANLEQEQKQAGMVKAIEAAGLTPQKFNEISTASQADPGLEQRIQENFAQTEPAQTSEEQAAGQ